MPHIVIAPFIIGLVFTIAGLLILIFHRWVLLRVPERTSNWDYYRYVRNTPLTIILFGSVVLVFGVLTFLRAGIQLF